MEETAVVIQGDVQLSGSIRFPVGLKPGERRPAFIVLHGFGSHKGAGNVIGPAAMLAALGYVVLRFDMRGCGDSEGEPGRVICMDQVADTRAAIGFLAGQPAVDPDRIALLGSSFGAAVAIYTGGVDDRVAAVISSGGWGHGERKFRGQHASPDAWARFTGLLEEGRKLRAETGKTLMLDRYDIVPIPQALKGHVLERSVQTFPVDTAQSMFDFRAEEVVGRIAPRPLLLLHSSDDHVTPTEQSIALFQKAGQPTDLHLFAETDHFMFADSNTRVREVILAWLQRYFPVDAHA